MRICARRMHMCRDATPMDGPGDWWTAPRLRVAVPDTAHVRCICGVYNITKHACVKSDLYATTFFFVQHSANTPI